MIVLDGSQGEGGGQILRTALALSLITKTPFKMERIRAKRAKPGLMRQHLTAVQAAAQIASAEVTGAQLGSRELTFVPRGIQGGQYRIAIGSAGSTMLVLQSVLPALLHTNTELTLEGGTHNPMAPSFDFLQRVFLPLLREMGAHVHLTLDRMGFYPAGGGLVRANVEAVESLHPLQLPERGVVRSITPRAFVASLARSIAEREVRVMAEQLPNALAGVVQVLDERWGPANYVSVEVESEHVTELFCGYGEKGVRAEDVATTVAREAAQYLESNVPVGEHLADQLLLPMALAGGGSFTTTQPSQHTTTQAETIARFLNVRTRFEQATDKQWNIEVVSTARTT